VNARVTVAVAISALLALIAWATLFTRFASATVPRVQSSPPKAAIMPDYRYRDAIVGDFEHDVRRHPDQLVTNMLAQQYLQRYREHADASDLLRAVAAGKRSISLEPHHNVAAESTLISALVALHQFRAAKRYAQDITTLKPGDPGSRSTLASIDMELGEYSSSWRLLQPSPPRDDPAWDTVAARYAELTGNVVAARILIARATAQVDSVYARPAENRAWYHWRAGELAFEAGDFAIAESEYEESLSMFPDYWHGFNGLAKLYWAQKRWSQALDAATKAANLYPQPETLGYKYDAQLALGDSEAAVETRDLIEAIERIGDAQGLSDRLIALFYADHRMRPSDAIASAHRDLIRRDDVYAEDTLAWALASSGEWRLAQVHADRAVRLGTRDARLQYHAGIIALHCGARGEARRLLRFALDINPQFHPTQADEARRILKGL
jgi:tetratricopeptide (TPR) repeat protein